MIINKRIFEFEWDKGNLGKNKKHKVEDKEAEEAYLDEGKVILKDKLHSTDLEERFILLGKTKKNRLLYIIFTERNEKIRIISARDVNKKEVFLYEETT
jgi:hypothetical protein